MANRFRGRGPYTARSLPVSGSYRIEDRDGKIILKPQVLMSTTGDILEELTYLAHLLNIHDLLDGSN